MMIGTAEVVRSRRQTSSPSSRGSITSSTTRSTCCSANRSSASSPLRAWITRYPSRSSGKVSSFWIDSSSSTSMIVASVATPWILERALYGKGACYKGACLAPVERLDQRGPLGRAGGR